MRSEKIQAFKEIALNQIQDLIFWISLDGQIKYINQTVCDNLGYTQAEIYAKKMAWDIVPKFTKKKWDTTVKTLEKTKQTIFKSVNRRKDGSTYPTETALYYINIANEPTVCAVIHNKEKIFDTEAIAKKAQFTIEHSGEMIFWLNKHGTFKYVNQTACKEYGYSNEELLNMDIYAISKDFLAKDWPPLWKALKNQKHLLLETRHYKKSGEIIMVQISANYIEYEGEELCCSFVLDITERKKQQRLFQLTHQTLNQVEDIIIWTRPNGKLVYFNDAVTSQLGYSREAFKRIKSGELLIGYEQSKKENFRGTLKKDKALIDECVMVKKDGTHIIAEINAKSVNYEGEQINCTIFRDITARKQSENSLRKSREEIQNIIKTATDAIVTADKNGKILLWNQAAERIFGWTQTEMLQQDLKKIIPNKFRTDHEYGMKRYKITEEPKVIGKTVELEGLRKDGSIFPLEISLANWLADGDHFFCGIMRDISGRKEKEKELEHLLAENQRLREATEAENFYLQQEIRQVHNFDEIITASDNYKKNVLSKIEEVADTVATVLITGETGTGKELIARAIHQLSDRNSKPLVKINCATLPENLIESELFGHEKGAFTGAINKKIGRFEFANNATIFLDEIGEMPIALQSKLLRVLQEGEFSRLGGNKTIKVDVRIIAATNRDLPQQIKEGKFREDLYYRLNVFPINNIPLRERKEDIPLLVRYFRRRFNERLGRKVTKISKRNMDKFLSYNYPGNIRELENIMERAMITTRGESLNLNHWKPTVDQIEIEEPLVSFEKYQRDYLVKVLKKVNWKVSGTGSASEILQIHPKTLGSKMRKMGIHRNDFMNRD